MNYSIRPMTVYDIDAVHAIEMRVHITPWSLSIIRDCVLVGYDCRVLEITHHNSMRLIGYIIARCAENKYHVLNLCIDKSFQHQGYGRKLLTRALATLPEPTLNTVTLEVRPSNTAAIALYQSMGFTEIHRKIDYYQDATANEDGLVLEKVLLDKED